LKVQAFAEKMSNPPTVQDQLELANRRNRLDLQLQKFEEDAAMFIGESNDIDSWMDEVGSEHRRLALPSLYGRRKCQELGIEDLAEKELVLRQGQANDALHQLRIDLGHRSYLYRTQVRHADHSQQRKTRAWGNVHSVDDAVKLHAVIYRKCRTGMVALEASPELLDTYQELAREHLTSQTTLIDPSLPGQRNKSLPWFWTIDIPADAEEDDWMSEC
jgi:hypothetical protein